MPIHTRTEDNPQPSTSSWLESNSFPLANNDIKNIENVKFVESSSTSSSEDVEASHLKSHKKKKNKMKKKKRRESDGTEVRVVLRTVEFNGSEEYYVDKAKAQLYLTVRTLHKPACPRYSHSYSGILGSKLRRGDYNHESKKHNNGKHYYQIKYANYNSQICSDTALAENDYTARLGHINRKTLEANCELNAWLDLLALQDQNHSWTQCTKFLVH